MPMPVHNEGESVHGVCGNEGGQGWFKGGRRSSPHDAVAMTTPQAGLHPADALVLRGQREGGVRKSKGRNGCTASVGTASSPARVAEGERRSAIHPIRRSAKGRGTVSPLALPERCSCVHVIPGAPSVGRLFGRCSPSEVGRVVVVYVAVNVVNGLTMTGRAAY